MSTRLFPLLFALVLAGSLAHAQEPAAAAESKPDESPRTSRAFGKPPVNPAPVPPAATPARKRSLFEKIFGSPKERATPAPTPAPATPVRRKFVRRPAPAPSTEEKAPDSTKPAPPKPDETKPEKPKPDEGTPPAPPKPGSDKPEAPVATPTPRHPRVKNPAPDKSAPGDADPDKAKYDEVKAKAMADPKVMELQTKAESATSEDEGKKALKTYNKALFQKMRSLDSTLEPRIDRMESAVMKRIDE